MKKVGAILAAFVLIVGLSAGTSLAQARYFGREGHVPDLNYGQYGYGYSQNPGAYQGWDGYGQHQKFAQPYGVSPGRYREGILGSMDGFRASKIIGTDVTTPGGQGLGSIQDLIVDPAADEIFAVISSNDRLHPVPLEVLRQNPEEGNYVLNMSRSQLDSAPSFRNNRWPNAGDPEWRAQINLFYYGARPPWE